MNETQMLQKLARRARLDKAPSVDAADAVLRRIRTEAVAAPFNPCVIVRPLAWVAACSMAVAVVVVPVALNTWQDWLYPLAGIADSSLGF